MLFFILENQDGLFGGTIIMVISMGLDLFLAMGLGLEGAHLGVKTAMRCPSTSGRLG